MPKFPLLEIVLDANGIEYMRAVLSLAEVAVGAVVVDPADTAKVEAVKRFITELQTQIAAMEAETSQTAPN